MVVDNYAKKIIEVVENKKLYKMVSRNCHRDLYKNWEDIVKEAYSNYLDIIEKKKN